MIMKKIILSLGLLIGMSSFAMAQSTDASPTSTKSETKECCMSDKGRKGRGGCDNISDLTDAQKEQIKKIDENFRQEIGAVMKSRISPDMQKERAKELHEKKDKDIYNVLNDEQKKQWDERKQAMKDCPAGKRGCPMDGDKPCCQGKGDKGPRKDGRTLQRGQRSFANFNRSQKGSQMRGGQRGMLRLLAGIELTDKQKEEFKAILDNSKKEMEALEAAQRAERSKIADKQKDAIKNILTSDQKKVFEENVTKMDRQFPSGKKNR